MQLIRFRHPDRPSPVWGVLDGTGVTTLPAASLGELLDGAAGDLDALLRAAVTDRNDRLPAPHGLLAPVDGRTEVWAAGVTYRRSREARMDESDVAADIYEAVYDAERPELFFKSSADRVAGSGQQVAIRTDATVSVPEPELAVVCDAAGRIVGYTVVDDVSSRDIEGANPLYLPQAKVWTRSCAVGPGIVPAARVPDPYRLRIDMTIHRDGAEVWSGAASTDQLHRRVDELAGFLFREMDFPAGAVLATGTCLVPDLPFTLCHGDRVDIVIESVGLLSNPVVSGTAALQDHPAASEVTA